MKVDAVVLAGARNDGALKDVSDAPLEALIEIKGKPMLVYVLEALRNSGRVGRIALVGPEQLTDFEQSTPPDGQPVIGWAGDAGGLVANIEQGLAHLGGEHPVLIVTSDIPLLTSSALNDFIDRCGAAEADVYYPIISRAHSEKRYPGVVRTYAKLADGEFTGGNCALLSPRMVAQHRAVLEQAVAMRKNPLGLARLFGLGLFVKLLLGRLRIRDVEERFRRAFRMRGAAVISPYPEIGLDVDKPADLTLVQSLI